LAEAAFAPSAVNVVADGATRFAGTLGVKVDDDGDFKPRRMRHLRQEHRAEFAGADQRCANRLSGRRARLQKAVEVHGDQITSEVAA
jgi:hypothetical protein